MARSPAKPAEVAVYLPRDRGKQRQELVACWIAVQTRYGVHGIGTSTTPSGRSASSTAFITAGGAAIAPASPTPLVPSGFVVAGVTRRSVRIEIRSRAEGMAYSAKLG